MKINLLIHVNNKQKLLINKLGKDIKNRRIQEQLISEKIVQKHIKRGIKINRNINGKPFIEEYFRGFRSVSISHNSKFVGVMISNKKKCGFDIEKISDRIEQVKSKFCSEIELLKFQGLRNLTLIWTFKEAIYKYYSDEKLNFKNEILILSINNVGKAESKVFFKSGKQKKITLGFRIIDDTVISYVKNEYPTRNI